MTWFVILVVLAAAFAPVAYMMPTKRDRALTDLRMIARREGLEVDVTQVPKLDAEAHERVSASGKARKARVDCVSYGLRLNKRQLQPTRWRVLRTKGPVAEFPVVPGVAWELDRDFGPATSPVPGPDYWVVLAQIEALLPKDVLALAVTDDFVLVYWLERLASASATSGKGAESGVQSRDSATLVADIRLLLNKVAQFHGDYFAPLTPDTEPETPPSDR